VKDGDREQLERAEARVLVFSYYRTVEKLGIEGAGKWLNKQIKKLEKVYGKGSGERIKAYMREVNDKDYFS